MRSDAAARAGITPDTFSAYVAREQAPAPVDRIGSTPLWDEAEIDEWLRTRPGRRGRPPGSSTKRSKS